MAIYLRNDQRAALPWAYTILRQEGGVLFADAPGFGKSYQALGLAQFAKLRPLILAPKSLVSMWRDLLKEAGLEGAVYRYGQMAAAAKELDAAGGHNETVIIVDEAHAFVNPSTQRYQALADLVLARPVILLSATPFQNRREDALHLLALFSGEAAWLSHHRAYQQEGLTQLMQRVALARQRVHSRTVDYRYFAVRAERDALVDAAHALCLQEEPRALMLHGLLSRRLSSYSAWFASIRRAARYVEELEQGLIDGRTLTREVFNKDFVHGQRAFAFMLPHAEGEALTIHDTERALERLRHAAQIVREERDPTPWRWLIHLPRPLVVFSQYQATVDEIYQHLRPRMRVVRWTGKGVHSNFPRTNAPLHTQLTNAALLATDVAAEGIDLRVCQSLVHADMHWNPMRTLQREGRIQRGDSGKRATIWAPTIPDDVADLWTLRARRAYKKSLLHRYRPQDDIDAHAPLPNTRRMTHHPAYLQALVHQVHKNTRHWHSHGTQQWLYALAKQSLLPAGALPWLIEQKTFNASETQRLRQLATHIHQTLNQATHGCELR